MPLLAEIKNQTPLAMISTLDAMEKIPVSIFSTSRQGSAWVAAEIAALIRQKQSEGKPCVLGLATGSTPISLYA
ncbi:MAG TPA: hypothetical protein DCQ29_13945, partial [Chitinophagaceae bacterium]|nr:hypothetical protein [Chitinophagaceae bacterium]